jgi:hypothetical protein
MEMIGNFTPRERTLSVKNIGGWADTKTGLDCVEKRKISYILRESNPEFSVIQLVARRYTDRVIPAVYI